MTTPAHDCADHIEVINADIDTTTGKVWRSMRCTVCGQTFSHCDNPGPGDLYAVPDNAVFGWPGANA